MRNLQDLITLVLAARDEAMKDFTSVDRSNKAIYQKIWKCMKIRSIMHGYPQTASLSRVEADKYMKNEEAVCLLCGRRGKATANHLLKIHKISAEEYRLAYKLPLGFGLISQGTRRLLSRNYLNNENLINKRSEIGASARKLAKAAIPIAYSRRKKIATYYGDQSKINISLAPKTESPFSKVDFLYILNLMTANDMTYQEVTEEFDVPKKTAFYKWRREPKNKRLYLETVAGLSFSAQARAKMLGTRFEAAAKIALQVHQTFISAAESLGVSETTLRSHVNGKRPVDIEDK